MGLSAGSMTVAQSGRVTGTSPAQGNAGPGNLSPDVKGVGSAASAFEIRHGVGSGFGNIFCSYTAAIAAGGSATYDLYTGTDIKDVTGGTAAFRILRGIQVSVVDGGDSSGVRIGGAASDAHGLWFADTSDKADITPDGVCFEQGTLAGKTVGTGTKNLKVENLGAVEVTIRILLAGSSHQSGEWMGFSGLTYA